MVMRADIEDVVALAEMEDPERRRLLAMADENYGKVAAFVNRYPDIVLEFGLIDCNDVTPEDEEAAKVFECPFGLEQV
jgi:hypothetical protein